MSNIDEVMSIIVGKMPPPPKKKKLANKHESRPFHGNKWRKWPGYNVNFNTNVDNLKHIQATAFLLHQYFNGVKMLLAIL